MALVDKISIINTLKKELEELAPLNKDSEKKLWQKFRMEWNYNSNHIEGNTLTYGETQLLILFDKTSGDHELREFEEMKAHDAAIHLVKDWASDKKRDLIENNIRELNKTILVKPYWKEAITSDGQSTRREIKIGEYKAFPNSVRLKNGETFEYTSPADTPIKMAELMHWYANTIEIHPIIIASKLHYDFIRIHPFDDGNGRVARLLVNYVLMRYGFPPLIIKSEAKEKYLTALNKADVGNIDAFHEYMAEQLIWSLEISLKAAKGESIDEIGDLNKKLSLLDKKIKHSSSYVEYKKSIASQKLATKEVLFPLIESLVKKISSFKNLFFSKGWDVQFNNLLNQNGIYTSSEILMKQIDKKCNVSILDQISFQLYFKDFKEISNEIKVGFKIDIEFNDYNYFLKYNTFKYYSTKKKEDDISILLDQTIYYKEKKDDQLVWDLKYNSTLKQEELDNFSEKLGLELLNLIEN